MKYGQNKHLKVSQNAPATDRWKMIEDANQQDIKDASAYRYYVLPKPESINVNIEIWITQSPFGGTHF